MADRILTGELPDGRGAVYACIDGAVRFTTPRLDDSRLGAVLHPFADEEAARAALASVGAADIREWRK